MVTGFFPPAPAAAGRHADMNRRGLLRLAGGGLAGTLLPIGVTSALAEEAEVVDPSITVETVTYPGRRTPLKGYVARPKGAPAKRPAVIIIHEVRGINAHFRDLARRLAVEGFLAFVPELASGQGTFAEGADEIRDYLQKLTPIEIAAEYQSASEFIVRQPDCSGAVGVIGFVWGGAVAAQLAAMPSKPVRAAVIYYSLPSSLDLVPKFLAAVQLHYAEQDPRTQPQIEPIEKKLIGYSKVYEQYVYEGARPNFANESLPKWYNKKQADLAWERTVSFLKRQLGG